MPTESEQRGVFDIAVVLLVLTVRLAYVNHRFVGLQMIMGIMTIAPLGLKNLGLGQ